MFGPAAAKVLCRWPCPGGHRIMLDLHPRRCTILVVGPLPGETSADAPLRDLEQQRYSIGRIARERAIDRLRSQAATEALARGFAERLWIDPQLEFDSNDVIKLRSMRQSAELPTCTPLPGPSFAPYFLPLVKMEGDARIDLDADDASCERARRWDYPVFADPTIRLWRHGKWLERAFANGSTPRRNDRRPPASGKLWASARRDLRRCRTRLRSGHCRPGRDRAALSERGHRPVTELCSRAGRALEALNSGWGATAVKT